MTQRLLTIIDKTYNPLINFVQLTEKVTNQAIKKCITVLYRLNRFQDSEKMVLSFKHILEGAKNNQVETYYCSKAFYYES